MRFRAPDEDRKRSVVESHSQLPAAPPLHHPPVSVLHRVMASLSFALTRARLTLSCHCATAFPVTIAQGRR